MSLSEENLLEDKLLCTSDLYNHVSRHFNHLIEWNCFRSFRALKHHFLSHTFSGFTRFQPPPPQKKRKLLLWALKIPYACCRLSMSWISCKNRRISPETDNPSCLWWCQKSGDWLEAPSPTSSHLPSRSRLGSPETLETVPVSQLWSKIPAECLLVAPPSLRMWRVPEIPVPILHF